MARNPKLQLKRMIKSLSNSFLPQVVSPNKATTWYLNKIIQHRMQQMEQQTQ